MSWIRQVGHVMLKDARHLWWAELLVVVALTGAALDAFEVYGSAAAVDSGGVLQPLLQIFSGVPLLFLAGLLLVGLLIQADSPARSDAFWVTRPLAPTAVLAAKAALAALFLLLLPLALQLGALRAHDVSAADIPPLLAASALAQVAVLAAAGALAALLRDLRSYVLAVPLAFLGWSAALVLARAVIGDGGAFVLQSPAIYLVWLVAGAGVLFYQYRVRDVRRVVKVAALPLLAAVLLVAASPGPRAWVQPPSVPGPSVPGPAAAPGASGQQAIPETLRPGPLRIAHMRVQPLMATGTGTASRSQLTLQMAFDQAPQDYRYALVQPVVRIHLPDGTISNGVPTQPRAILSAPGPATPHGFTGLGPPRMQQGGIGLLTFLVPPDAAEALSAPGATKLELLGRIEVLEPRELGVLPLRPGATLSRGRYIVRITSVQPGENAPEVALSTEAIERSWDRWDNSPWEFVDFSLIRPDRYEALPLESRSRSSGPAHGMVLPGVQARGHASRLEASVPARAAERIGPGWGADAELYVQEWVPRGDYELRVRMDAPRVR